jgi:hypothetical protein
LSLDIDGINKVVEEYDNESKALKEELFRICWYMRGTSIAESYLLSYEDRQIISKIIEKNLEITKETGQPFF